MVTQLEQKQGKLAVIAIVFKNMTGLSSQTFQFSEIDENDVRKRDKFCVCLKDKSYMICLVKIDLIIQSAFVVYNYKIIVL